LRRCFWIWLENATPRKNRIRSDKKAEASQDSFEGEFEHYGWFSEHSNQRATLRSQRNSPIRNYFVDMGKGNRIQYADESKGDAVVMLHGNPVWSFSDRILIRHLVVSKSIIWDVAFPTSCRIILIASSITLPISKKWLSIWNRGVFVWWCMIGVCNRYVPRNVGRSVSKVECLWTGRFFIAGWFPSTLPFVSSRSFVWGTNFMATTRELDSWRNRPALHKFITGIPLNTAHSSWETLTKIKNIFFLWYQKDYGSRRQ
jgi:hypothetical protein